jgi:hypothetical protein
MHNQTARLVIRTQSFKLDLTIYCHSFLKENDLTHRKFVSTIGYADRGP